MQCLPDNLSTRTYYQPTDQGFEARLCTRMEELRKRKAKKATS
jgi:replication-associated recombination protein RarA